MAKNKWIQDMDMKKGALKKSLGVKKDQKIPESKLDRAVKSKNPLTKKRATLAKTLSGFKK